MRRQSIGGDAGYEFGAGAGGGGSGDIDVGGDSSNEFGDGVDDSDLGDRLARGPDGAARRAALAAIAEAANGMGVEAWVVGGAVRDALLGFDPGRDLDVVIIGDAAALAIRLAARHGTAPVMHRRFGTATWRTGPLVVDLISSRAEHYERPGALPSVRPGALADDLARRDITINAMAAALRPDGIGPIIDPFDGASDLDRGVIRVLHDRSFIDDPTRILRAARFAARFGFAFDAATQGLAHEAVAGNALATISPARLGRELTAVLAEPRPSHVLALLEGLGVLGPPDGMVPDRTINHTPSERDEDAGALRNTEGVRRANAVRRGGRISDALPAAWSRLARGAPGLALPAHIDGVARRSIWAAGETTRRSLGAWLPVSAREQRIVRHAGWRRAAALADAAPSRLARALAGRPAEAIVAAWLAAPWPAARAALRRHAEAPAVPCPVDGNDILALGVARGPAIRRILEHVRDAWYDGTVTDRAAALRLAEDVAGTDPATP